MKKIIVLVGPSGSGKTRLGKYLEETHNAAQFVSTTTRKPRRGELNGVDYHFVSKEEFTDSVMIEWTTYANNLYGLSVNEVMQKVNSEENNVFYAVMEIEGAKKISELLPPLCTSGEEAEVITVFVSADIKTLMLRMRARGDSFEKIAERIDNIFKTNELDGRHRCDYELSNNGDIEFAFSQLDSLLADAWADKK
ncbi:guanylate kinase [Lachnospiraceae bacterium PF1-22]